MYILLIYSRAILSFAWLTGYATRPVLLSNTVHADSFTAHDNNNNLVYETAEAQVYWDVPVYGEFQELRANRVDARIVNNQQKQVIALEMSCPWVSNRDKKTSEKTMKYAPLRWEMKQSYPVQSHHRRDGEMVQGVKRYATEVGGQQS